MSNDNATSAEESSEDGAALGEIARHVEEVEAIVRDFQRLLMRYESSLEAEGLRDQMETMDRWIETYRLGLHAAKKITKPGRQWLQEAHEKLLLAAQELQRMDEESPSAVPEEQEARMEELVRAKKRLDTLIPEVEQVVAVAGEASQSAGHEKNLEAV